MSPIEKFDPNRANLDHNEVILAGYTASTGWAKLIQHEYKFDTYRVSGGFENKSFITLTHISHPIFGNYLVTAPYSSYGGVHFESIADISTVTDQVTALSLELNADYANIRFLPEDDGITAPSGWHNEANYCTFKVDLSPTLDSILSSYSSNHRNHVRKSLKKGHDIKFGREDILEDTFIGLSKSMHELGSPYHQINYLQSMLNELGEDILFSTIYSKGKIAGAGVFIREGNKIINLHANVLRKYRNDYAGEFFYWKLIEEFKKRDFSTFDLGRSLIGSGNEVFKMKWNPTRLPLQYWYYTKPGMPLPGLNQKNPKFRIAIETWKRLPKFVVDRIGHYLIRGIA